MAVSRRLRYEILRRDKFTCTYCHRTGQELHVDHVIPIALGGSDEPSNLTTACAECNAGKSASAADAPIVEQVDERARDWASAMEAAADLQASNRDSKAAYVGAFDEAWAFWTYPDGRQVSKDENWRSTVERWHDLGLEIETLTALVDNVLPRTIPDYRMWRYFCGAAWGILRERQEIARQLLDGDA